MQSINFKYTTIKKNNKILEKYGFDLVTHVKGIRCRMQLDTGAPFTFLIDRFIKKYKIYQDRINSKKTMILKLLSMDVIHILKMYILKLKD